MNKRRWIIVGTVFFILFTSYGLMKFLIAQKQELSKRPPNISERWVKAEPAVYKDILSPVTARGRVASTAEVNVVSEAAGRIEPGDVPLKIGQSFREGQNLLTIYKDEAKLALKAQKSRFQNTVANLLPDIRIDFAEYENTFRTFFDGIRIESPLPPLPDVQDETLKIFLASRNVLADYYAVQQDELKLSRHTIKAPFNGVFSEVNLEVGSYTNVGGRIATILATGNLEVDVAVSNGDAQWIKKGDPVLLRPEGREQSWKGIVTRVSDFVDETTQSRSVFVHVTLTGQDPLYTGEYLQAVFQGAKIKEVVQLPRNALFNFNEIFTVQEGLLKVTKIDVVKLTEKLALIRGVEPGTYIVVQPLINVSENTAVKILGMDQPKEVKIPGRKPDEAGNRQ